MNRVIIGSDNGLLSVLCQAFTKTKARLLSMGSSGTNCREIMLNITQKHSRICISKHCLQNVDQLLASGFIGYVAGLPKYTRVSHYIEQCGQYMDHDTKYRIEVHITTFCATLSWFWYSRKSRKSERFTYECIFLALRNWKVGLLLYHDT